MECENSKKIMGYVCFCVITIILTIAVFGVQDITRDRKTQGLIKEMCGNK